MDKLRELLPPTDVNLVLYHGHCTDGFGAAWVAHTVLNTKAEYVGVSYGKQDQLSQFVITKETNVLLVDYSFDLETCQKIKEMAKSFIILDHHKTAEQTLSKLDYAYFDMNKSGITLAWEYFYPNKEIPEFVRCIETRDLWKFEERQLTCPHALAFTTSWYNEVGQDPKVDFKHYYDILNDTNLVLLRTHIITGNVIIKYVANQIKNVSEEAADLIWQGPDADTGKLRDYKVKVINNNFVVSDLGNYLSNIDSVDFAVIWTFSHKTKAYRVSLRSNGKTDVSFIAKLYRGGGHRGAAGFTTIVHPDTFFKRIDY
jgi:oligoribonuclease NrnB/cAMP/cGMP phosphodiesterase (DHH superfamily)